MEVAPGETYTVGEIVIGILLLAFFLFMIVTSLIGLKRKEFFWANSLLAQLRGAPGSIYITGWVATFLNLLALGCAIYFSLNIVTALSQPHKAETQEETNSKLINDFLK